IVTRDDPSSSADAALAEPRQNVPRPTLLLGPAERLAGASLDLVLSRAPELVINDAQVRRLAGEDFASSWTHRLLARARIDDRLGPTAGGMPAVARVAGQAECRVPAADAGRRAPATAARGRNASPVQFACDAARGAPGDVLGEYPPND